MFAKGLRLEVCKGVFLLYDNVPAHSSVIACQTAGDCGYQMLPHPPYSPELAPSDFFLFPGLKSSLKGCRFGDDNDVISATDDCFSSKDGGFYKSGIRKVKNRWQKCITLAGSDVRRTSSW
jgi:histone-lysine N-methyltransferase SETMAR